MLRNWALALRPSLSLDFLAGLNDSRITYSGGANGTRVNSSGVIVAATTPRFDYDPVTLAARGLLVEEARTNLALRSGDLSNAAWSSAGALTVTGGSADPSGGTTGTTLDDTDGATFSNRYQDFTVANDSTQRVMSFFLKQGTAASSTIQLVYFGGATAAYNADVDWATKTVTASALAVAADVSITPWYDGYYRVSVRGANNSSGNTSMRISVVPAGISGPGATGSCIAWGGQCELGTFPTSYIPTTSASVTRTADSAVMTGTNFSSWYNATQGSFISVFDTVDADAVPGNVWEVGDGTFNERMNAFVSSTPTINFVVTDGGIQVANFSTGAYTTGNVAKSGIAYAANDFAGCLNGGTVGTDTSGALPTVDAFYIGRQGAGGASLNGHIQSIAFYPRRLSNEQLQALTS